MNQDQVKWDKRYSEGAYAERGHPSALLVDWLATRQQGRACDIACGRGRNSRFMASQGYSVDGYDISPVGLELAAEQHASPNINWVQRDVLTVGLPTDAEYDVIIMFRFVALELLAELPHRLTHGGMLIVENHLRWPRMDVELAGPGSDRFRVASGAQSAAIGDRLEIKFENEGLAQDPDGSNVALAQLVAIKSD